MNFIWGLIDLDLSVQSYLSVLWLFCWVVFICFIYKPSYTNLNICYFYHIFLYSSLLPIWLIIYSRMLVVGLLILSFNVTAVVIEIVVNHRPAYTWDFKLLTGNGFEYFLYLCCCHLDFPGYSTTRRQYKGVIVSKKEIKNCMWALSRQSQEFCIYTLERNIKIRVTIQPLQEGDVAKYFVF